MKIIMNNPKLNLSILTLFICIFIEYFLLCLPTLNSLQLIEEANFFR